MRNLIAGLIVLVTASAAFAQRDIYVVRNASLSNAGGDTWDVHIVVPSADRFIGWAYLDPNDSTAAGFGGAVSTLTSGTFLNLGAMTAGSGGTDPNVGPNSTWMGTAGTTGAGGASGSGFTPGYGAPPLAVANSVEATRVMARILQADSPAAGHAQYDFIAGRLRTSVGAVGELVVDARYAPGTTGRINKRLALIPEPTTLSLLALGALAGLIRRR